MKSMIFIKNVFSKYKKYNLSINNGFQFIVDFKMTDTMQSKLNFIENKLPSLMQHHTMFAGQKIVRCTAEAKTHLDGFMSSIFTVKVMSKGDGEDK